MEFDQICKDILAADNKIRFAMITKSGNRIAGGYRKDIENMIDDEELQMSIFYAESRWDSRKNLEHKIGKPKYSITEYEKVKRFTFPVDNKHLLLLSTEIDADNENIIKQISNIISSQDQYSK